MGNEELKSTKSKSSKLSTKLNELEQQVKNLNEALLRERADSMNMRRRHDEQISGLRTHIESDIINSLLPVIDNFERSLKHIPKDLENNEYISGIRSIIKQFEKTIEELGVKRIKSEGEVFDPKYHEALSMDEEGQGTYEVVSEELMPGYKIGDHVIRHAKVKVKRTE